MLFGKRNLAFVTIAAVLGMIQVARSQSASYSVSQHGKPVGTATVTFANGPDGVTTTSVVRVTMQGLNYSISKTEQLSRDNQIRHVQLSATVNGSAVSVVVNTSGGQILMNTSANGRSSTAALAQHDAAVFMPDFDPGALDRLLTQAAAHGGRDLWAVIPKGAGSIVPIELSTLADEQGTLDGKPVNVHHLIAVIRGARTDLFAGPANQLLQAELPQQGFALVRNGFVLTPPAKAGAPPQPVE